MPADTSIKPQRLNDLAWFYEEESGLTVCQQPAKDVNAVIVTIPWRMICVAVDQEVRKAARDHAAQ